MKNILIIGLGRFGKHMAIKFLEEGNDVLAIDFDEERAEQAMSHIGNVRIGDSTNEDFIKELDVKVFDMCVCAIGDDFQRALETVVLLKDYNAKFILARATRDVHKKLLLRNGADVVVYSEREMAEKLAVKYGSKNVFDYIEISNDYSIYEIKTPDKWIGKTPIQIDVRNKYGVNILASKQNGNITVTPAADYVFSREHTLLIMGHNSTIEKFIKKY